MFQFVYVSSEVIRFTDEKLRDLLEVSRRRNSAAGLTGLLLYANGSFIQLLEGPQEEVLATRARIEKDPRHSSLVVLLEGPCETRDFEDWSMGFRRVAKDEEAVIPGFRAFFAETGHAEKRSAALRMLEFFRELNTSG